MGEYSKIIGEKEVVCSKCGHNKSNIHLRHDGKREFGECQACGDLTYIEDLKIPKPSFDTTPKVKCPYCNSTNTRKITTASKVGKVALFGIFAIGKTSKEWHCNDCKSDF